MQRVVYAFCLSKITKFVICLCLPRVQEVVRRVRRDASVSAAGRSHTQHALWVTLNTWLKPVTGPVSRYLGSFWLPLAIRFSKQTPSYDEICSFCLHRCRYLNGKIKNPIPWAIAWYTAQAQVSVVGKWMLLPNQRWLGIPRQTKVHKRKEGWPQSLPFLADALKHCSHP